MNPSEIVFLVVLISFLVGVYLTFRVIRKYDDEDDEDIWS